jgi:hypothetical protein
MAKARPSQITDELNDVWGLVVGYTKQETVAPLRGLGRFMKWGAIGMVLFALGTAFGTMAIVRGVQSETHNWIRAFAPYVAATAWLVVVGVLAVRSLARTPWKQKGDAK